MQGKLLEKMSQRHEMDPTERCGQGNAYCNHQLLYHSNILIENNKIGQLISDITEILLTCYCDNADGFVGNGIGNGQRLYSVQNKHKSEIKINVNAVNNFTH